MVEYVYKTRVKQILTLLTPRYMILGVDIGCLAGLVEVDDAKAQKQSCSTQCDCSEKVSYSGWTGGSSVPCFAEILVET
jgi:hypothetical protein